MAFKGGFLVKPTTTSTDALAGLYLNGVKAIADKKREIQKEELGILKEATEATNIPVSGVSTIDSLMGQYGVSKRKSIQELYDARQRGEISTDQYTMGMVNHTSETKLFSRLPEFIAKENAEIQKGIEEGKLSGINADLTIGRFRDLNGGNPEAENQVLTPYHQNGQGFIKLGYTVNGEPRSQDISITKLMDPNKKMIQRFDLDDYTKKFKEGLEQQDYLTVREVDRNGVKYIEKTVDASKSLDAKRSVNRNVGYLDDDAMIDILYQKLGARLDYSSDYKEYTEEDVKNRFGYRTDRFSIDLNERGIEIRPEHLTFKVENNKIKLTPEQEDIARGIVRAELYDTLGVKKTAEIIKTDTDTGFIDAKMTESVGIYAGTIADAALEEINAAGGVLGKRPVEVEELKGDFLKLKGEGVETNAMNIRPEHSELILNSLSVKSASGSPMKNLSNIVVVKIPKKSARKDYLSTEAVVEGEFDYKVMFVGESDIAQVTQAIRDDQKTGTFTTEKYTTELKRVLGQDVAVSGFQKENKVQDAYLELYKKDEAFKKAADDLGFGNNGDPGEKGEFYNSRFSKAIDVIFRRIKIFN